MRKLLFLICFIMSCFVGDVFANQIIDSATNTPIGNARVTIPKYNYSTYTDENGNFNLDKDISKYVHPLVKQKMLIKKRGKENEQK